MSARAGLSYRIIDGDLDVDVTEHVQGTPELTWNAVGGCETARLKIDLPLSTFPNLGRRSLLVVTDHAGRPVWDGYCTDPGGVDDDAGQAFDLTADGSMSAASLRVGRLVYVDRELGSWTRAKACVESAQTGQVDDETFTGWRIGHPQGQVVDTGALAGIEYRHLGHADHGIGRVSLTVTGAADDAGFDLVISTYADGVVVDSFSSSLSTTPVVLDLIAGDDIGVGCDAVQIAVVRVGGATNVTTPFAFIDVPTLVVEGATVDQWGSLVESGGPMTSARVVADLIGRGLLGPVDPDAAVIVDSGVEHSQLSWATGIRGSAALEKLRETDAASTWMYGTRGPGGYVFEWSPWASPNAATTGDLGVRYDLGDQDSITSTGSTELPADRVMVVWTDADGEEHTTTVELPGTDDPENVEFARDLDPIVLGESTSEDAIAAGVEALGAGADVGRTVTVTVSRQVLDRATGLNVEPHELRPGCLARLEATGDILRVQTVTARGGDAGGTAELTLGDPPSALEDRMLAVVRGEVDPTAPLIPVRRVVPTPPPMTAPVPPEIAEMQEDIQDALDAAEASFEFAEALNKVYRQTSAPTNPDPDGRALVTNDAWFDSDDTNKPYRWSGSAWVDATQSWLKTNPTSSYPNVVVTPSGLVAYNSGGTAVTTISSSNGTITTTGSLWTGGDISGATVTGGTVQTTATSSRGIKINSSGLAAYDGSGTVTLAIAATTGAITMKGDLTSGSTVTGATVSGGTVMTSGSGLRAVMETSGGVGRFAAYSGATYYGGLEAYTLFGSPVVRVSSATGGAGVYVGSTVYLDGDVDTAGNLDVGGDITGVSVLSAGRVNSTDVYVTGTPSESGTGLGAVYMGGTGRLRLSSSAAKYKTNIEPLVIDVDTFMELEPVTYDPIDGDDVQRTVGFIADRAHALGFTHLVGYRDDEVETLHYERVSTHQQAALRQHHSQLAEDRASIAALVRQANELRDVVATLTTRIDALETS